MNTKPYALTKAPESIPQAPHSRLGNFDVYQMFSTLSHHRKPKRFKVGGGRGLGFRGLGFRVQGSFAGSRVV